MSGSCPAWWDRPRRRVFHRVLFSSDLEYSAGLEASKETDVRRWYSPDAKVKAALRDGVERLRRESVRPDTDREFGLAADEMARVVELLEKSSKP